MDAKSKDEFLAELEQAKKVLESLGRDVCVADSISTSSEENGLAGDFDLPYSSLPTIYTSRWKKPEVIA